MEGTGRPRLAGGAPATHPTGPHHAGNMPGMEQTSPVVLLQAVHKSFPLGQGRALQVLDIARLVLPSGSYTVVQGPSGSGKTTLLNLIAGIALPSAGQIQINGTDITTLPEPSRDRFRAAQIGYIFQNLNLLAPFTALENVMLAMRFANTVPKRQQRQRAADLLSQLGLGARLSHRPEQLSRGEQQRVAIARALANEPPVLLADEPCASLDAATAHVVLRALHTLCHARHTTVLVVAHDNIALDGADQVLDMRKINRATGRSDGVELA
jgi:ABC-type lipoprotein export system ATPase subunit